MINKFATMLAKLLSTMLGDAEDSSALSTIIEFLIYVTVIVTVYYFRAILLLVPFARRLMEEGEKYSGYYLQIIGDGDERRYSLIKINYKAKIRAYFMIGFQYDLEFKRAIDFDSVNVDFRDGPSPYFEFVWRAETVTEKKRFDGYTYMCPDDNDDPMLYEGRGFFITFDQVPRRFNLKFLRLSKKRLKELGLKLPKNEKSRAKFIKALHEKIGDDESLSPQNYGGKAQL